MVTYNQTEDWVIEGRVLWAMGGCACSWEVMSHVPILNFLIGIIYLEYFTANFSVLIRNFTNREANLVIS